MSGLLAAWLASTITSEPCARAAAQERMRAGPHYAARLNPRLLQAITQNPELLQVLMSRTGVPDDPGGVAGDERQTVGCAIS